MVVRLELVTGLGISLTRMWFCVCYLGSLYAETKNLFEYYNNVRNLRWGIDETENLSIVYVILLHKFQVGDTVKAEAVLETYSEVCCVSMMERNLC